MGKITKGEFSSGLKAELESKAKQSDLSVVSSDLGAHQAEKANSIELGHIKGNTDADGKLKADSVNLTDVSNNFTNKNVEGAMNELFTNVSNGKELIGTAITDVDEEVDVPINPSFSDLASAISGISTGKKWASGKYIVDVSYSQNTDYYFFMSVRGLGFKPSMLILLSRNSQYIYLKGLEPNDIVGEHRTGNINSTNTQEFTYRTNTSMLDDGFSGTIYVKSGYSLDGAEIPWMAFE